MAGMAKTNLLKTVMMNGNLRQNVSVKYAGLRQPSPLRCSELSRIVLTSFWNRTRHAPHFAHDAGLLGNN